jgi:hypothetical protein
MFWAGKIELYYLHLNVRIFVNFIIVEYLRAKSALLLSEHIQTISKTSTMSLVNSPKTVMLLTVGLVSIAKFFVIYIQNYINQLELVPFCTFSTLNTQIYKKKISELCSSDTHLSLINLLNCTILFTLVWEVKTFILSVFNYIDSFTLYENTV